MRFALVPGGARLWVDGVERAWFGVVQHLGPGTHEVVARMPPGEPCCLELVARVEVARAPAADPHDQVVVLRLPIRPARATLRGAPPGGFVACESGLLVKPGKVADAPMDAVQWTGACHYLPGATTRQVTLRAGQTTVLEWPR